jgi:hypothetical protein
MYKIILMTLKGNALTLIKQARMVFHAAVERSPELLQRKPFWWKTSEILDTSLHKLHLRATALFQDFLDGRQFRDDPHFLAALESFGNRHGMRKRFHVIEVPDDTMWEVWPDVEENDDYECAVEVYEEWRPWETDPDDDDPSQSELAATKEQ